MLDTLVRDVGARLGLGDQAQPLVQMLVASVANPATGGLAGFLDKFRAAGLGGMVQSWLGTASVPQVPTTSNLETVLGGTGGLLGKLTSRLGLPADKVASAVATLLPMLISRMTPGGTVPATLPSEFGSYLSGGLSLLGLSGAGAAAASTVRASAAPPVSYEPAASPVAERGGSGIGKWLPWVIAAIALLFGLSYCGNRKDAVVVAPEPAPAVVPAPAEPVPAPAVQPAPAVAPAADPASAVVSGGASAGDTFTAPAGAGVLDGLHQAMPMLRVFFDTGKTEVSSEFAEKARSLVAYLQDHPEATAVISGFNDPTGDPVKNAELSKQRAQSVQAALTMAGVPADRAVLEKPVDATDSATASNAASRRVDVMLRK